MIIKKVQAVIYIKILFLIGFFAGQFFFVAVTPQVFAQTAKTCSSTSDPQACQNTVKQACSGKTGADLAACESTVAQRGDFTGGGSQASNLCQFKDKKQACINEILKNNCKDSACATKIASKYDNIVFACRSADNPQGCNTDAKNSCNNKTGAEIQKCLNAQAATYKKSEAQATKEDIQLTTKGVGKQYTCGSGEDAVKTRIDLGCTGKVENPIIDMAYALLKFFSFGVGLVLAASIIWAGIQYSSSQGNPEATQAAKNRIQNAIIGLVFYLLIFAAIQFLVPGGLFNG